MAFVFSATGSLSLGPPSCGRGRVLLTLIEGGRASESGAELLERLGPKIPEEIFRDVKKFRGAPVLRLDKAAGDQLLDMGVGPLPAELHHLRLGHRSPGDNDRQRPEGLFRKILVWSKSPHTFSNFSFHAEHIASAFLGQFDSAVRLFQLFGKLAQNPEDYMLIETKLLGKLREGEGAVSQK